MYHKVILAGNLGRDPEMRYLPDGTAVTSFSMAVSDGWGDRKKTIWFRVTCWRKTAEFVNQYMAKGRKVLVEGTLQADDRGGPRTWTSQDGTVRASFEITANTVQAIGGRADAEAGGGYSNNTSYSSGGSNSSSSNSGGGQSYGSAQVVEEDDIPF